MSVYTLPRLSRTVSEHDAHTVERCDMSANTALLMISVSCDERLPESRFVTFNAMSDLVAAQ